MERRDVWKQLDSRDLVDMRDALMKQLLPPQNSTEEIWAMYEEIKRELQLRDDNAAKVQQ